MQFRNDFKTLHMEIEKLVKRDQHHIVDQAKFIALKKQILDIFKTSCGETSRHYRVVRLTNSPATIFKVMNHTVANKVIHGNAAVNM